MAIGGGGGGPYPHHIAAAFATLEWKDKAYYDGLKKAEKALLAFGVKANSLGSTLGFKGATTSVGKVTRAIWDLRDAIKSANTQANKLATTLGSLGGGGSIRALGTARAGSIRAIGVAVGSAMGGLGKAMGSTLAGFGRGLGNVLSGAGGGGGSFVRGGMAGFGRMFRDVASGFGTALTAVVRNSTSLLRSLVSTLMSPLRMAGRLARVGGLIGGIGGGLTAGAAAYGAVSTASKMESQAATLRRITGASRGEMAGLTGSINRAAGRTPGVGLSKFYEVAETGARMGIPTGQLAAFTNGMARLGIVLDEQELPLQEAANRIGSLISVFGLSADSAERFGSALVKLDQMSTASARDIIDIANRFSGPAAAFGMKPQESLALATALRQARVPVETAGTSVGQVLMRMASKRDLPAFAKLGGMKAGAFAEMLDRDPIAAIKAVTQGLAEMDRRFGAVATSRALDTLHLDGQRVRGTMLQLARTIPLLDTYLATANNEWQTLASIMEGAEIQGETLSAQFELLQTSLKLVAVEAGKGFLPMLKGAVVGVRNLSRDIASFVASNGPMLEEWGRQARLTMEGIGTLWRQWPTHLELAKVTTQEKLAQIAKMFENFGQQIAANFNWLTSNLPAMIGNAIKAVGPQIIPMLADLGRQMKAALAGELDASGAGKLGIAAALLGGTRLGRGVLKVGGRLAGGAVGLAAKLPGPLKVAGLAAAGLAAAPGVGRAAGGWVGRRLFGAGAPEWNPRLANAPAGIPRAPGFNLAGLLAGTDGLKNSEGKTFDEEQERLRNQIKGGVFVNSVKDFAANPPAWARNAATVAMNPMGALAGLAGTGVRAFNAMDLGGTPILGRTVPGTRAYRAAMRAKQAGYVNGRPVATPQPLHAAFGDIPQLGMALPGELVPGTRAWAAHHAEKRARAAGRGDGSLLGGVYDMNRARRGAANQGFRQWRSNVNAMMRGEMPMFGDGRRQAAKEPVVDAVEKGNSILKTIADALTGGASAKPGGGGAAGVWG